MIQVAKADPFVRWPQKDQLKSVCIIIQLGFLGQRVVELQESASSIALGVQCKVGVPVSGTLPSTVPSIMVQL